MMIRFIKGKLRDASNLCGVSISVHGGFVATGAADGGTIAASARPQHDEEQGTCGIPLPALPKVTNVAVIWPLRRLGYGNFQGRPAIADIVPGSCKGPATSRGHLPDTFLPIRKKSHDPPLAGSPYRSSIEDTAGA
jgi:hypothetical protein